MTQRGWILLGVLAMVVGLPACADGDAATADAKKDDGVAAYYKGEPITMAEVEKEVAAQLREIEQRAYDVRRETVAAIVLERIVNDMAAAEGITREQFLQREIQARAVPPTAEEIKAVYDQYKDQPGLAGKTLEEATPLIAPQVQRQKLGQAQAAYAQELLAKADLRYVLQPPRVALTIPDGEPSKGPANAPITLVEYSDFQCGYCKRAHPTIKTLLEEYGDKIRLVYRDYGIPSHDRARASAEAARCAGDQDKYWVYFDNLMENPGPLDDADLAKRATDLGLDMAVFQGCLDSDKHVPAITASFDSAGELGIGGTPTFFINGRMIVGARSIDEFRAIIDEELAAANPS
jgi:protein-disulfide isomerase